MPWEFSQGIFFVTKIYVKTRLNLKSTMLALNGEAS